MAKNFGIKFIALQIGMLIFGVLLFIMLFSLKNAAEEDHSTVTSDVIQEGTLRE